MTAAGDGKAGEIEKPNCSGNEESMAVVGDRAKSESSSMGRNFVDCFSSYRAGGDHQRSGMAQANKMHPLRTVMAGRLAVTEIADDRKDVVDSLAGDRLVVAKGVAGKLSRVVDQSLPGWVVLRKKPQGGRFGCDHSRPSRQELLDRRGDFPGIVGNG